MCLCPKASLSRVLEQMIASYNFFTLHGGDGLGNGLTVTVSSNISPGNYAITIKVYGENVPEQIHSPKMIVLAS